MTTRALAKVRARRRSRDAGAIIFIVAMTLAVLASLGLYAMHAATTEIQSSGYARQSAQTHYLAEYGMIGAAQEITGPTAQLHLSLMLDPAKRDHLPTGTTSGTVNHCYSLMTVPSTATNDSLACRRMGASELGGRWSTTSVVKYVPASGTTPATVGSLGAIPLDGDFFVELTEPAHVRPPAGYDLKLGLCFIQFTVTAAGLTQPAVSGQDTSKFGAAGLEMGRGRIVGGPVRCAQ